MAMKTRHALSNVPAIRVKQWLDSWDNIKFNAKARQARPKPEFFLFSMSAADLKALTGIYRRTTNGGVARADDPNIQRGHDEGRSGAIRDFVRFGYPWCELNEHRRKSTEFNDLRKPGWLPTAIVVNIIAPNERRDGKALAVNDAVEVVGSGSATSIKLPKGYSGSRWRSDSIPPLEVIDGQHRLWAFDGFEDDGDFELPVVAFDGLDRSWQAYLFWSINITPKRIKQSLAFDLYPLLRTEDWLERFEGHSIYRETRAQELVEALWSYHKSPWHQRVNMLGEAGLKGPMVSQAAWIRSLMATFVKGWEGKGKAGGIGGLFGAKPKNHEIVLPWSRAQQAAFLIAAGTALKDAVKSSGSPWAKDLRRIKDQQLFDEKDDPAFQGQYSLLGTDQGIRGFLSVTNDIFFLLVDKLNLEAWKGAEGSAATDEEALDRELKSLNKQNWSSVFDDIAAALASYDWRTSSTPDLPENERKRQGVYRGSSGYKELRSDLLTHVANKDGKIGTAAAQVKRALGY
jgi:hypothetical protein